MPARSRRRRRSRSATLYAGEVFERAGGDRRAPARGGARDSPHSTPQSGGRAIYAEKITPADRELDLDDPLDSWRRVRALSPHIGAWTQLQGRRVTIWRARLDDGVFVPELVQPEGRGKMSYDEFLRGAAGDRSGAQGCVRRRAPRLRGGGVRGPRPHLCGRRPRRARPGARAAARVRDGADGSGRSTSGSSSSANDRCASSTRRCARRFGSARTSSRSPIRPTMRSSTTPSSSCARRVSSARCRSRTPSCGGSRTASSGLVASLPEGPVKESYPDWIAEIVDARSSAARPRSTLMRAQNEPPGLEVRADRAGRRGDRRAGRVRRRARRHRAHAADEPRVTARRARRRLAGWRADPRPCAAPGGKTTMLARRRDRGRGASRSRRGDWRRTSARTSAWSRPTPRELDESGFDRALVDAPCSGLGVLARRPDLRWRARPLPELQLELLRAAAERTKPGGTIVYAVCTLNADENEAVVDASGLAADPLGAEWPQYAHPKRPEFLLTLTRPRPDERLLHRAADRTIASVAWADWIRTVRGRAVAVRRGLRAARRPDRGAARRRLPRLPFRRR